MRKSNYSEEQIIGARKRAEQGVSVKDICRELGISSATLYQWRSKYGGRACSHGLYLLRPQAGRYGRRLHAG